MKMRILFAVLSISIWNAAPPVAAQESPDLAKAAQKPVAAMISLPFQNNILFGVEKIKN